MAEYAYGYYDVDPGSHKRQRIGPADQHLWAANEPLTTDLTPHAAYDPVRDILHDGTIFAGSSCFDFATTSLNDSPIWYSESNTQIFEQPYGFEDQHALLTSEPFCEQTTAAFVISFRDFNEPEEDFPQDTTEATVNELAHSLDAGESLSQDPTVICFGMVGPNLLRLQLESLTCFIIDCRRSRSLQSIRLSSSRIRVSTNSICPTQLIAALQRWPRTGFRKIGRANGEDICEFIGRERRPHPDVLSEH
jgi:hypothetical protein